MSFGRALRRIQSNNIALSAGEAGPENYTLPVAVTAGKAFLAWKGKTTDATADASSNGSKDVRLSHSTTAVTATRVGSSGEVIVEFDLVEFF